MDDMPNSSPTHDSDPRSDRPRPEPIPNPKRPDGAPIPFSHPAEEAFAQVLDFYHERWEYEPMTFPLRWDETGRITMAFSPDFYLPDEDLYVELTTMRQRLVTHKNRKLRLLSELYPGVKCKLIYRRDVANLAVKYGLFEADSKEARQVYQPHPLDGVTGWGGSAEESEEMERDA
jgi:hypoxanthine phosphoribosyltransferase